MEIINYTDARANLATIMDKAADGLTPIAITRKNAKPVVMISLDEYNSWLETHHLLQGKKSQKRLLESVKAIKSGKYAERKLIENEK